MGGTITHVAGIMTVVVAVAVAVAVVAIHQIAIIGTTAGTTTNAIMVAVDIVHPARRQMV